jgi:hypothetical protein
LIVPRLTGPLREIPDAELSVRNVVVEVSSSSLMPSVAHKRSSRVWIEGVIVDSGARQRVALAGAADLPIKASGCVADIAEVGCIQSPL